MVASLVLDRLPSDSDTHSWADFVELLALVNLDGTCTADAAVDRIHDIKRGADDDEVGVIHDPIEGEEPIANEHKRPNARHRRLVADAFALMSWRATAYGDAYPFSVDHDGKSITVASNLSPARSLYLFLLIAANLRFVRGGIKFLTDEFEVISKEVLTDVLPAAAEVHLFGKASSTRYSGSAFQKIAELVKDVRGTLIADEHAFRPGDTGDSGIDIVGWHGLADEQRNIFVYLGQCACSRDQWTKKQMEASPGYLANTMSTTPEWVTILFVPICFRRIGGAWYALSDVGGVVLMDRMRLLRNAARLDQIAVSSRYQSIVDEIRSEKESIV